MSMMRKLAMVMMSSVSLIAALAYSSKAQTSGAEQQVRAMEEARRQALLHNDTKALDSLLAPDYTAIFEVNGGRVNTRAVELATDQAGSRKVISWEPSDVNIRIYGDVGLVTGLAEIVDVLRGVRRHIRFRYTHVWVKRDGNWQMVHRHTHRVATLEGPTPDQTHF